MSEASMEFLLSGDDGRRSVLTQFVRSLACSWGGDESNDLQICGTPSGNPWGFISYMPSGIRVLVESSLSSAEVIGGN